MIPLLARWRRPRATADASHLTITVYSRRECCCCHKAIDLLKAYQPRYGFTLEERDIDIDEDPALRARYDTLVPVVAVGGKVRFKGVVNPVLLERLLRAESQGHSASASAGSPRNPAGQT